MSPWSPRRPQTPQTMTGSPRTSYALRKDQIFPQQFSPYKMQRERGKSYTQLRSHMYKTSVKRSLLTSLKQSMEFSKKWARSFQNSQQSIAKKFNAAAICIQKHVRGFLYRINHLRDVIILAHKNHVNQLGGLTQHALWWYHTLRDISLPIRGDVQGWTQIFLAKKYTKKFRVYIDKVIAAKREGQKLALRHCLKDYLHRKTWIRAIARFRKLKKIYLRLIFLKAKQAWAQYRTRFRVIRRKDRREKRIRRHHKSILRVRRQQGINQLHPLLLLNHGRVQSFNQRMGRMSLLFVDEHEESEASNDAQLNTFSDDDLLPSDWNYESMMKSKYRNHRSRYMRRMSFDSDWSSTEDSMVTDVRKSWHDKCKIVHEVLPKIINRPLPENPGYLSPTVASIQMRQSSPTPLIKKRTYVPKIRRVATLQLTESRKNYIKSHKSPATSRPATDATTKYTHRRRNLSKQGKHLQSAATIRNNTSQSGPTFNSPEKTIRSSKGPSRPTYTPSLTTRQRTSSSNSNFENPSTSRYSTSPSRPTYTPSLTTRQRTSSSNSNFDTPLTSRYSTSPSRPSFNLDYYLQYLR